MSSLLPFSDLRFVHVTPAPVLSRLEGLDDRMLRFVEMLPCMLLRGGIATADVTAGETQAQMHPARADSQAILAALGARRYIANHFQMRVSHVLSSSRRRSIVESAFRSIQWIRSTILPSPCPAAKRSYTFAASAGGYSAAIGISSFAASTARSSRSNSRSSSARRWRHVCSDAAADRRRGVDRRDRRKNRAGDQGHRPKHGAGLIVTSAGTSRR